MRRRVKEDVLDKSYCWKRETCLTAIISRYACSAGVYEILQQTQRGRNPFDYGQFELHQRPLPSKEASVFFFQTSTTPDLR